MDAYAPGPTNAYTFSTSPPSPGVLVGWSPSGPADLVMKPAEALALDLKIDDGRPATGIMQNDHPDLFDYNYENPCDTIVSVGYDNNLAVYQSSVNSAVCAVSIGLTGTVLPTNHNFGG